MATVKEHYDKHLGDNYSWMIGDMQAKMKEQEEYFRQHKLTSNSGAFALDLGAGNGLQSIPLARLGYSVIAIDYSKNLLTELKENAGDLPIRIVTGDFADLLGYKDLEPELIVCCGDSIAHLEEFRQVEQLMADAFEVLHTGGFFCLSFRDYSAGLQDIARFIPVRSDENQILTCFLEFSETTVQVTDILQKREGSTWKQQVSSYNKLRITPAYMRNVLTKTGFRIVRDEVLQRMNVLLARKV